MKKQTQPRSAVSRLRIIPFLAVIGCIGFSAIYIPAARADNLQQQIDSLNAANAENQSTVGALQIQASNYQDAIDKLRVQIAGYQSAIDGNKTKQAHIQAEIDTDQVELNQQKSILGDDLKAMYVNGEMSTVEMLATSKNLSSFVDAETYRSAVQGKIQKTLDDIANLENELEDQKTAVQGLLQTEQGQQQRLANDQSQEDSLLNLNQSQQAAYNSKIKANNAEISKLQSEQIAQNEALFGNGVHYGGTGSYPYANAVCMNASGNCGASSENPYNWGVNGQPYDPAGWQFRNCTSYAFWRLDQARGISLTAGYFPNVSASGGKIGYSIPDFQHLGYTVDHNPSGATLAVEGAGPYGPGTFGHIMYIESSTSTSAYVSQYNEAGDGQFSTMTLYPSSGIWFVHIP